jgi:hypothetical protein
MTPPVARRAAARPADLAARHVVAAPPSRRQSP